MLGRKSQRKSPESEEKSGFDSYELRLGDVMRGERATMGKSLLDVQRELKIKATYIAAVENADPSVFETPGFIAGYVRSYARFLNLDPEWAFERFCAESGFAGVEGLSANASTSGATKGRAAVASSPRIAGEDSIIKPVAPYAPGGASLFSGIEPGAIGSIAVIFALIGTLGYGGWAVLQEIQRVQFAPVDQAPGLSAQVDTFDVQANAEQVAELGPEVAAPTPDALDRLYRPQALEAPVLTPRDGPIASLDPNSIGALVDLPDGALVAQRLARTATDAPVEIAPETPQVVAEAAPDVVLFAVRPAWVRVASADGTVLFEKILEKGERYVVPQTDEAPLLRAGNSGSLYFQVQGEAFGPAGPGTSVAKNVALSVDAINGNYAAADLEADPVLPEVLQAMAQTPLAEEAEPAQ